MLPFQFLRSQTQEMGTDLVRALEAVRVTKRVVYLARSSALVFPFLAVGYGAYWLVRRYRRKSDAALKHPGLIIVLHRDKKGAPRRPRVFRRGSPRLTPSLRYS